jgi:signal transduction histidine kinase
MAKNFFSTSGFPINLAVLSFQPGLEQAYQDDYFRKSLTHVRIVILLAIFNYLIFGILDNLLAPLESHQLWFIRYAVFTPFALFIFLFSFTGQFKKYFQLSLVSVVLVAGFGIIGMTLIAPPPNNYSYYAGLILVFFYLFTFIRVQFVWASITGIILLAAYEFAAVFEIKAPVNILVNNNFFFITSEIVGMCACYSIDFNLRKNFIQKKLLVQEQEKVRKINEELEQKIRERTKNLTESNKALKEEVAERSKLEKARRETEVKALTQSKMASLGAISTGVAHEINQPLTFIKIIFESILRDLENKCLSHEELTADSQESLQQIQRISVIIDHLRTFGRADSSLMEKTQLKKALNNTLILFSQRLKLNNITFKTKIPPEIPDIYGNPIKLEQVFINLLQNSIDALAGRNDGEITVSLSQENQNIAVQFADNGSGIPNEIRDKIFEPFFTNKEVGKGTGLGLSIVYGIIQEHNGTIKLVDNERRGTTFLITVPFFPADSL